MASPLVLVHKLVPDGWQRVHLEDVVACPRGAVSGPFGSSIGSRYYVSEGVPVIRGNNLPSALNGKRFVDSDFVFLTDEKADELSSSECLANDLVFTARGTIGQVGLIPNDAQYPRYIASANQLRARADLEQALPLYLYFWFSSAPMLKTMQSSSTSTGVPNMNLATLKRLPILLPPLPEQQAIAAVLDSIDEAIERTEAVIAATEKLRGALLHQLLTRGVPGWHTEWKEDPRVGTIPVDWKVVRLGDVLETTTYGTNVSLDGGGRVPILRMNNLQDGEIDLTEVRSADLANEDLGKLSLVPGDILFNRTNSLDLVGKVAVVRDLPQPMSFASYLVRLRVCRSRANPFWLSSLLGFPSCQSRIRRFATPGVSQANINPTSLKSLLIPLPPLLEQRAMATVLDGIDAAIEKRHGERERLQSLKGAASDALLTGRVRVHKGAI